MFGVLMSVQPLKPTSFQPRSSATMWTMLGFLSAAKAVSARLAASRVERTTIDFFFMNCFCCSLVWKFLLHSEHGHVGLALENAFRLVPELDFPEAAFARALQINCPAFAALADVLAHFQFVRLAVVEDNYDTSQIQRRVGHLELQLAEIIVRAGHDDRIVIRPEIGLHRPD